MRRVIPALSILFILFQSCEESAEGCLDRLADNYGFDAVTECDSCCVYPDFKFDFDIFYDTLSYSTGDTLVLPVSDSVIIDQIQFAFSDFSFSGTKEDYQIIDSFVRKGTTVIEDHAFFERSATRTVGMTRIEDRIEKIRFVMGLDQDEIFSIKPFSEIDQSGELDSVLDSLYIEEDDQLNFAKFSFHEFERDTSIVIYIPNSDKIAFDWDTDIDVKAGEDWTINVRLDLKTLLDDLDLSATEESIQQLIIANMSSSLSLE